MKKSAKLRVSSTLNSKENQNSSRIQFGWYGQEVGKPHPSRTPKQNGDKMDFKIKRLIQSGRTVPLSQRNFENQHWDGPTSIADPECLSRISDPKYFNPKNGF
jgi:hypothetical protein